MTSIAGRIAPLFRTNSPLICVFSSIELLVNSSRLSSLAELRSDEPLNIRSERTLHECHILTQTDRRAGKGKHTYTQGRPSHGGNEAEIFMIPILGGNLSI